MTIVSGTGAEEGSNGICCLKGKKWVGGLDGDYSEEDFSVCPCPADSNQQTGKKVKDQTGRYVCCGNDSNLAWDGKAYAATRPDVCGCPKDAYGIKGHNKYGACCDSDNKEWNGSEYVDTKGRCTETNRENRDC